MGGVPPRLTAVGGVVRTQARPLTAEAECWQQLATDAEVHASGAVAPDDGSLQDSSASCSSGGSVPRPYR